jgi:hypothetical protein
MARARNIKPGFFRNADLAELPVEARLLFIGLWTLADRNGRLEDRPRQIKMEIFPADGFDCEPMLAGLSAQGFITRYSINGKKYLHIVHFADHQNPHGTEKDGAIPDENGFVYDFARTSSGHQTGPAKVRNVLAPLHNSEIPGIDPAGNGQIPGIDPVGTGNYLGDTVLNPESGFLNPDSLNPDSKTRTAVAICESDDPQTERRVSIAGAICMVIKAEGMASVNPSHPELLALIDAGADVCHFAAAARTAVGKGKGFAYLLAIVKGQLEDATGIARRAGCAVVAPVETNHQRLTRERAEAFAPGIAARSPFTQKITILEAHDVAGTAGH